MKISFGSFYSIELQRIAFHGVNSLFSSMHFLVRSQLFRNLAACIPVFPNYIVRLRFLRRPAMLSGSSCKVILCKEMFRSDFPRLLSKQRDIYEFSFLPLFIDDSLERIVNLLSNRDVILSRFAFPFSNNLQ